MAPGSPRRRLGHVGEQSEYLVYGNSSICKFKKHDSKAEGQDSQSQGDVQLNSRNFLRKILRYPHSSYSFKKICSAVLHFVLFPGK